MKRLLILATLLMCSPIIEAKDKADICDAMQYLLTETPWRNPQSKNVHYFTKVDRKSGKRTIGTSYANYSLRVIDLTSNNESKAVVCMISFTFLNEECKDDIHSYFLEMVGDGLRLRVKYYAGDGYWQTFRDSEVHKCDLDPYYIIPIRR